jgi:hypothetical protein
MTVEESRDGHVVLFSEDDRFVRQVLLLVILPVRLLYGRQKTSTLFFVQSQLLYVSS